MSLVISVYDVFFFQFNTMNTHVAKISKSEYSLLGADTIDELGKVKVLRHLIELLNKIEDEGSPSTI